MRLNVLLPIALAVLSLILIFNFPTASKFQRALSLGAGGEADYATKLRIENDALRAELALLQSIKDRLPVANAKFQTALVYSRYPFNFKKEFVINAGANSGVAPGAAILISGGGAESLFVGRVKDVYETTAVVQTIFDAGAQTAVRVGNSGVEALLKGGNEPTVILIPKEAVIQAGDPVYVVEAGAPLGIAVGSIGELKFSSDQFFKEATLRLSYDLPAIEVVNVELK